MSLLQVFSSFVSEISHRITDSPLFEGFILVIIIWNIIMLCIDDPLTNNSYNTTEFDAFFLYVYTVEMALKIFAHGFVFNRGAYLRKYWNWIDGLIVITGYLPYVIEDTDAFNINSLRILRVFRPLRAITFLSEMRRILMCLVKCLPNFINIMVVYCFFLWFFAICALQIYSGVLKRRCYEPETGLIYNYDPTDGRGGDFCGYDECAEGYICGKIIKNPNFNVTNFDNIAMSLLMIFQTFTINFDLFSIARTTNLYGAIFFFTSVAFVGLFLLQNLMISVISTAYEADKNPNKKKRSRHSKESSIMPIEEFLLLEDSSDVRKKNKIMMDPNIPFDATSQNDVLELRKQEIIEAEKAMIKIGCRKISYAVYKELKLTEKQIANCRNEYKWVRRVRRMDQRKEGLNSTEARYVLKNKKRQNLPLKIHSKLLKFRLMGTYMPLTKSDPDPLIMPFSPATSRWGHISKANIDIAFDRLLAMLTEPIENAKQIQMSKDFPDYEAIYNEIRRQDFYSRTLIDRLYGEDCSKSKFHFGWPGKELEIAKFTIPEIASLRKKERIMRKTNEMIKALNTQSFDVLIWLNGIFNKWLMFRKMCKKMIDSPLFEGLFLLLIFLNVILLCLEYSIDGEAQQGVDQTMTALTYIFIFELVFKVIALGYKGYIAFPSNILDGCLVIISVVQLVVSDKNSLTAFRAFRLFRTLRVFRLIRFMRSLRFISLIIEVLFAKFTAFVYILLMLFLLLVMFTLIGEQMFAGKADPNLGKTENFDSFYNSFLSCFQILAILGWTDLQVIALNTDVKKEVSIIFLVAIIVIGNYIFLNLFVCVLIGGFLDQLAVQAIKEEEAEDQPAILDTHIKEDEIEEDTNLVKNTEYDDEEGFLWRLKREKPLYYNVECEESLFLFPKRLWLRKVIYRITLSRVFVSFILLVIVFSSLKLALDTYDMFGDASGDIDWAINAIFIAEAVMKIITFGLVFCPNSYLRNGWNILDLFVVLISVIDRATDNDSLFVFKILRLLRILRPLRFLSHDDHFKLILGTLFSAVFPLIQVIFVTFLIYLIFAVFAMSFLGQMLGYCDGIDDYYDISLEMCIQMGGVWSVPSLNFDNIYQSLLSMFVISTLDGWYAIMYETFDANSANLGPNKEGFKTIGVFFLISVVCLTFIMMNLYLGVLIYHFGEAQTISLQNSILLTNDEKIWTKMQPLISDFNLRRIKPQKLFKSKPFLKRVVKSKAFEYFIMICIIGNIVILAMPYEGSPRYYDMILENFSYAFTAAFIFEFLFKILALGPKKYFTKGWNRLDFTIVALSILELILSGAGVQTDDFLRKGPQIFRIFKVIRVIRMIKILRKFDGMRKIMLNLTRAFWTIIDVALLLALIYYIFAVLAVFLFQEIKSGTFLDEKYNNFTTWSHSFMVLIGMISGQSWSLTMIDCFNVSDTCTPGLDCGTIASPFFFISFVIVGIYVIQNLFVLVLIDTFSQQSADTVRDIFTQHFKVIKEQYLRFIVKREPHEMLTKDLIPFFQSLKQPLGLERCKSALEFHYEVTKMEIRCDAFGVVSFKDLLFAILKRIYNHEINQETPKIVKQFIETVEKKTLDKIDSRVVHHNLFSSLLRSRTSKLRSSEYSPQAIQNKKKSFNALLKLFYSQMTFKAWRRAAINPDAILLSKGEQKGKNISKKMKPLKTFTLKG